MKDYFIFYIRDHKINTKLTLRATKCLLKLNQIEYFSELMNRSHGKGEPVKYRNMIILPCARSESRELTWSRGTPQNVSTVFHQNIFRIATCPPFSRKTPSSPVQKTKHAVALLHYLLT